MHELFITYMDNTHWAKLANQKTPGIWAGYAKGHSTGTYWVFNPKTKKIILTWEVTFLQKTCSEYSKVEKPVLVTKSNEGLDDEKELETVPITNNNDNNSNLHSDSDIDANIKNDSKIF